MSAIDCPICKTFSSMFAQCDSCGIKMCHGCYCKGAMSKCPSCGKIHQVKVIKK